jgi:hypothetical protein
MSAYAMVIVLALMSQLGAASDRFQPPPRAAAQPGSNAAAAGNNSGSGFSTNSAAPAAGGGAPRNFAAPSGNGADPYSGSAPQDRSGNSQTVPLIDSSTPTTSRQTQPPPSNYQGSANPLSGSSASSSAGQQSGGLKPAAMMRAMLTAPRDSQLPGNPVGLMEVLSSAVSRPDQTQRVEAYWDMCTSAADYYLALRERDELQRLRSFVPQAGATWEQEQKEMEVRIGTSLRAARASQLRLAGLIGRGPGNLPLPADLPHCGNYNSHYQEIFGARPSPEAQELASLLPQRYEELKAAGAAVTRAEEWLDGIASMRTENSDGTASLRALELLALRRRAFVQIARDYNRRIARYAELATPGQIGAERLVGILIKRDSATATRSALPAPPENRRTNKSANSEQRTYAAEEWAPAASSRNSTNLRDNAVQPASATESGPRQERSLLVTPR